MRMASSRMALAAFFALLLSMNSLHAAAPCNPYHNEEKDITITITVGDSTDETQNLVYNDDGYPISVSASCKKIAVTPQLSATNVSRVGTHEITATYDGHTAVVIINIKPRLDSITVKPNYKKVGLNTTINRTNFNINTTPNGHEDAVEVSGINSDAVGKKTVIARLYDPLQSSECEFEVTDEWILYVGSDPVPEASTPAGDAKTTFWNTGAWIWKEYYYGVATPSATAKFEPLNAGNFAPNSPLVSGVSYGWEFGGELAGTIEYEWPTGLKASVTMTVSGGFNSDKTRQMESGTEEDEYFHKAAHYQGVATITLNKKVYKIDPAVTEGAILQSSTDHTKDCGLYETHNQMWKKAK